MAIMTGVSVIFVAVLVRFILNGGGAGTLFDMRGLFRPEEFSIRPVLLGAGTATLSYIGFDAISTLAEDTRNPEKDIALATVLVCVLQTLFCVVTVYLAAVAWPDYKSMPHQETAIMDIAQTAGGNWTLGIITMVLIVAGLASALTGQAGASRLLFGMSRDGVLPKLFAHVDRKHSTPTRSIYVMGAFSAFGAVALRFDMAVELLNFGALAGFILVNLSVIRHYYIRGRRRSGMDFLTNLVFPMLGALVCGYVWVQGLSLKAQLVGFAWLGAGVIYLAVLTRGFREKPKKLESLVEESAGAN
jgi:amino acid transporter